MAKSGWSVRRSQLITTYGVGALVTTGLESVMVVGLDHWKTGEPDVHEPRLERRLRVSGFRRPPASDSGRDVPVVRFPSWVFCPSDDCEAGLDEHRNLASKHDNQCPLCEQELVPSRFVVACSKGHIDDFPYFSWVHMGSGDWDPAQQHSMRIESKGTSAALRDINVVCSCGKSATMDGALAARALRGISRCRGRRPWLPGVANETCDEVPRALQRGGSNVWFPVLQSALSIPPWSEAALQVLNKHWPMLKHIPESAVKSTIEGMKLHTTSGQSLDDLADAVSLRKMRESERAPSNSDLRQEEFEALVHGRREQEPGDEFVCVPADQISEYSSRWFSRVMVVERLLEIRALQSFSRILPSGPDNPALEMSRLSDAEIDWLPAIDVKGEGVFLQLNESALKIWESLPEVVARATVVAERHRNSFHRSGTESDREITSRLLLAHTLAHVMINEWALHSGYPAASLRERLYVSDEYAGILLYTATGDSAGSLGGVIAQAAPDRLDASLRDAIERARWCSSDPLCIESEAHGVDSLNLAACHACVLLPEVSCEEMNVLLDRALLIGTPENPSIGFFNAQGDSQ